MPAQEFVMDNFFQDGFFDLEDLTVGQDICKIQQSGFNYSTEDGLDFCQRHIFGDPHVLFALQSFFDGKRCILAHWLRYGEYEGHIQCFVKGGIKVGRHVFMVHALPMRSRIDYWCGSHLCELPIKSGERSTYELDESDLQKAHCTVGDKGRKEFDKGGKVILDARLSFEIKREYAITFIFATRDIVDNWPKMVLPNSAILLQKVKEMEKFLADVKAKEGTDIGLNFVFQNTDGCKDA